MRCSLLGLLLLGACAGPGTAPQGLPLVLVTEHEPLPPASTVSLRGLSVPVPGVVWASGSAGTVLRSVDAGVSWSSVGPEGAGLLDFRMVWAFDADEAWLASAGPGPASRLFHTLDGGASWSERLANTDPDGFWDGLAFWDRDHGLLLGDPTLDPVSGRVCLTLLVTVDGGASWARVPADALPAPISLVQEGRDEPLAEYCFAASNGSLALAPGGRAWVGTGGAAARVLATSDRGRTWTAAPTPLGQGDAAAGIFALELADVGTSADPAVLVAVGGSYDAPASGVATAAWSSDGGRTWQAAEPAPAGYRSSVARGSLAEPVLVAAGTEGASLAFAAAPGTWYELDLPGANALAFEPGGERLWAVGPGPAVWSSRPRPELDPTGDRGGWDGSASLFLRGRH
jgi:photosystem II stability/assembly factor-like uncharacterized protein